MPLLRKFRVLSAKIETTPGTAEALGAADAAYHCYDCEMNADITVSDRPNTGSFGTLEAPLEGHMGTASFKISMYGDSGSVPAWMDTFFPACGLVKTGSVFSPVAAAPGSQVKTLTIGMYEDGIYKQLRGCAGTFSISCPTATMSEISFTFTGIWSFPSDVSIIAPAYPDALPYRGAGSGTPFSFGSWQPCISSFSMDLGNNVVMRPCTTDVSGFASAIITDRNITASFDPESALVADYDIYGDWESGTQRALTYMLEDADGGIKFDINKAQVTTITSSDRDGVQIDEVSVRGNEDDLNITVS